MKVSIVIPTYRRPALLARVLASIARQTYTDYEVIVVDDGSPESTEYDREIAHFAGQLPALSYLRNAVNLGAPGSRNRGIRAAQHDLVALVDDDDEWLPTKLEKQVALFARSPEQVALIYTWADVVEHGVRHARYRAEYEGGCIPQLLHQCFIPSPSVMVRKTALLAVGLFDEQLPSCQDWDLWTRLLEKGYEVRVLRDVLTLYHRHEYGSIGGSPEAREGYRRFYRKQFRLFLRHREWRHLVRYFRLVVGK